MCCFLFTFHLHFYPTPTPPAQVHPQTCSAGWRPAGLVMVPPLNTAAFTPVGYGVERLLRLQRFLFGLFEWRLAPKELVVFSAVKQRYFFKKLFLGDRKESLLKGPIWEWKECELWIQTGFESQLCHLLATWLWEKLFSFYKSLTLLNWKMERKIMPLQAWSLDQKKYSYNVWCTRDIQ